MGGKPRVVKVEELEVGDLIEVRWLDASEARTSLSLPDREFDTPVRSIGVFGGLRGSRTKHIIVIKEEFAVAETPEYHYNAIPVDMVEAIVLARRKFWKKHDVRKAMSLLDGLGESSQVDVSRTPRARRLAEEGCPTSLSLDELLELHDFWLREVKRG